MKTESKIVLNAVQTLKYYCLMLKNKKRKQKLKKLSDVQFRR